MAKHSNVEVDIRDIPEKALRKFKRLCDLYGISKEYRKRQEFKKPSMRKKEKIKASQKRRQKSENPRPKKVEE
jgi:small subunit ribosomal protein S21